MNDNVCKHCDSELRWNGGLYHCDFCSEDYQKLAFCPDCEQSLEKLQACGAASYFCPSCNELKSKTRVTFVYKKQSNVA
ncbi:zinc ribbon domain-containing protein [Vibrio penaeicida]|uniref:zinc ribbon domain-containing protein n=1 Tax=Vibrio penaeicida TaxID=104609 RepID=UPI000CE9F645|nr:zinc ribbon domain-containing protein [Vibrio penaeicida]